MLPAIWGSQRPSRGKLSNLGSSFIRRSVAWTSLLVSVHSASSNPMAQAPEPRLLTRSISERDHLKFLHNDVPSFFINHGFSFTWVEDLRSAQLRSPARSIGPWDPRTVDRVIFLLRIEDVQEKHALRYRFYLERIRTEQSTPYQPGWHTIKKVDPRDEAPEQLQEEILEKLRQEFIA